MLSLTAVRESRGDEVAVIHKIVSEAGPTVLGQQMRLFYEFILEDRVPGTRFFCMFADVQRQTSAG